MQSPVSANSVVSSANPLSDSLIPTTTANTASTSIIAVTSPRNQLLTVEPSLASHTRITEAASSVATAIDLRSIETEQGSMDRVSQLQDAVDQLTVQFVSSLDYLSTRAPMVAHDTTVAAARSHERALPLDQLEKESRELASDIAKRCRQIDTLIDALPTHELSKEEEAAVFAKLEQENQQADDAYKAAVEHAKSLLDQLKNALRAVADSRYD
ncbi:hypothetical protein BDF22DRAFT_666097 [Syncephalis plumigaleata]|nr:hypothetical protein BDF22DRAFT_666097 [Syncephalis plumigaleata]